MKYRTNETKERSSHVPQPSKSLSILSSELRPIYSLTSTSTVPLCTAKDVVKTEVLLGNFTLFTKKCRWISRVNTHVSRLRNKNKFTLAVKNVIVLELVSNRKEMDVHLLYLDSVDNRLVKSYIGSYFMGYSVTFSNLESI